MNELNLNEVRIAGIIGNDLRIQEIGDTGKKYLRFNVGTTSMVKGADNEPVQQVNWTRCACFGPIAEHVYENCQKGTNVYIVGRLESKFINSEGKKRELTEVAVAAYHPISGLKEKPFDVDAFLDEKTRERKEKAKIKEDVPF